ncbi:MAG TPA: ATP-grasp domain-containing protein [Candidatus Limnocylindrales bacterium]|nr:ATP-grasp domain-containing protein [Candidatus Limnocylindrales bacterium]
MTALRVLLLEASGPEATAIADTAGSRGYQVYAVTQADRWAGYSDELRRTLAGHLLTDLSAPAHALGTVLAYARKLNADAVLTTNEYLTPLASAVCAELGLPGNDHLTAHAARNKAEMADRFARCGVPAPRTFVVRDRVDAEVRLAESRLGYPMVVKPAEAAGSSGVTVVEDPADLSAALRRAISQLSMYGARLDPRVLIQEHVAGTEFSVESLTQNGITTHLCLTRKLVASGPARVETGHALPANAGSHTTTILEAARCAIAAVGITNGASHTEVMLSNDGRCKIIEVAARIGAGHIGFLIHHALGIDPWTACLDIALGRPAKLTPPADRHATVRFLTSPRAGRLVAITGLPEVSAEVPIVRVRTPVGADVHVAADNSGRLGCFAVVGSDATSVMERADGLLANIVIDVEPVGVSAN